MSARRALFRQSFRDGRTRTFSFAAFFVVAGAMQAIAYEKAYPSIAERKEFMVQFGQNAGIRIFYGVPHDLVTTSGYVSWRVGGTMTLALAIWGVLAGARVRAEEDSGRQELVLSAPVSHRTVFSSFLLAVLAGAAVIGLAGGLALAASGLEFIPSLYLGLAVVLSGVVFAGVGAVCAQVAPSRRTAITLGTGVFAIALLLRVAADTTGNDWLRWFTPLGWSENMQALVGARPWVALLPLASAALLFWAAARISASRDVGSSLLASRDRRAGNLKLLGSPMALSARLERGSLIGWSAGIAAMAAIFAGIAHSVTSNISSQVGSTLQGFGASELNAQVYIGFLFVMYVFAACLFVCSQLTSLRHEESDGRLETELAEPVARARWLLGRLVLTLLGVVLIAAVAALFSWIGAHATGTDASLGDLAQSAVNCVPSALLFLGIGILIFSVAPRATTGITYALVSVSFLWWMFGSLLSVPTWTLDLSPFRHVALIPIQDFKLGPALVMCAIGVAAIGLSLPLFRRRDLAGA